MYIVHSTSIQTTKVLVIHCITSKEDPEALSILLQLEKIDPNAKMSNGFTPFLLAAARGRMLSFEILVGDKRVDVEVVDKDGKKATDLVKAHGKMIVAKRANELLGRRCTIDHQSEAEEESAVLRGSISEVIKHLVTHNSSWCQA